MKLPPKINPTESIRETITQRDALPTILINDPNVTGDHPEADIQAFLDEDITFDEFIGEVHPNDKSRLATISEVIGIVKHVHSQYRDLAGKFNSLITCVKAQEICHFADLAIRKNTEAGITNMGKIYTSFRKGKLQGLSSLFKKADEMSKQKSALNHRFAAAERETIKAARKLGARNEAANATPSNPQAQSPLASPEFNHSGTTFTYVAANGNPGIEPLT